MHVYVLGEMCFSSFLLLTGESGGGTQFSDFWRGNLKGGGTFFKGGGTNLGGINTPKKICIDVP